MKTFDQYRIVKTYKGFDTCSNELITSIIVERQWFYSWLPMGNGFETMEAAEKFIRNQILKDKLSS